MTSILLKKIADEYHLLNNQKLSTRRSKKNSKRTTYGGKGFTKIIKCFNHSYV